MSIDESPNINPQNINPKDIIACSGQSVNHSASDLLAVPGIGQLIKSPTFLFVFRGLMLALFAYCIYFGFVNPSEKTNHVTTGFFWSLFWPFFMLVSLVTLGPVICTLCPHGFIGSYLTRWGLKKSMPKKLRNPYIGLAILLVGYWGVYYTFNPFNSPLATAIFFLVLSIIAVVTYLVYDDMAYCRYICPMGPVKNAFGKMSFLWLSTYDDACKGCKTFDCAKSCEHKLSPFNFNKNGSMDECTLCMNCAQACPAVKWQIVKPSFSLLGKIKKPREIDIWSYLMLLAVITITMRFHHALGRTAIADEFPWSRTAHWLEGIFPALPAAGVDTTGVIAMVFAIITTLLISLGGLKIASIILKTPYQKVFSTLGYAFAPLMIVGGLGHVSEFFFLHYYSDIANAFNQLFQTGAPLVEPLAKRGEPWLHNFQVLQYIAVFWSLYLFYKRMQLITASTQQKLLAAPFVSAMPAFYIGMILYTGYVFSTYGAAMRHAH